jgi:two-component system NarL family sensor kinase
VLEHAGLVRALEDLARAQERADRDVVVDTATWPDDRRTNLDALLFGAARELLGNAVKHAAATRIVVTLESRDSSARLVVADNGRGVSDQQLRTALDAGHVGLTTQRLRVEAAGGRLTLEPGQPAGTVAIVELPLDGIR